LISIKKYPGSNKLLFNYELQEIRDLVGGKRTINHDS